MALSLVVIKKESPTISPEEFSSLILDFAPFEGQPIFAVAVSGGADSLALILLLDEWARSELAPQGTRVIGLTVDHGLRTDSTVEALQVQQWLKDRDIEHHILTWQSEKPQSALQSRARRARYDLLSTWCLQNDILHLLTAHHATDQLETFLIRLSKGSGLKGLTGIKREIFTPFGRLIRPVLDISSDHLKATLKRFGQGHIEDPSNQSDKFDRTKWRQLLPLLAEQSLTPEILLKTLNLLQADQHLLEQLETAALVNCVTLEGCGIARLKREPFTVLPRELGLKVLQRVLMTVGGRDYSPKREALESLYRGLMSQDKIPLTLAGCHLVCRKKEIIVGREYQSVKNQVINLSNDDTKIFDHKFLVSVSSPESENLLILKALGPEGLRQLKKGGGKTIYRDLPQTLLTSLPSLWRENRVIAIPHLTWKDKNDNNMTIIIELHSKRRLTEN